MTENDAVLIPSQTWYNLVIFDCDTSSLKSALTDINETEDLESILETIEMALDFINDRMVDESYVENEDYNLDSPSKESLQDKKKVLLTKKREVKQQMNRRE